MTAPHWEYFLAIESDLLQCSRYVEFTETNFATHSVEFARILFAAASEFDVVAKLICLAIDEASTADNIGDYRSVIPQRFPRFPTTEVRASRFGLRLHPWAAWREDANPAWWRSYNNVKHQRDRYFGEATLANSLAATAGLLCGLLHYYRLTLGRSVSLWPEPKLFEVHTQLGLQGAEITWTFAIPDDWNDEQRALLDWDDPTDLPMISKIPE